MPGRATEWEPEAQRWIEWTRTPGFDAYWHYRGAFFDEVLAPPGLRTLEVGCGEGRVSRDLGARGHDVVAIEPAATLLAAARDAGSPGEQYAIGDASVLPFADGTFDIVVAYNVLQVVDDLDRTLREIARVLTADGCLCACIAHPVTDLGDVSGDAEHPRLAVRPDYYEPRRVDDELEIDGRKVTCHGRTHSLEDYARGLEQAGLVIERVREPRPPETATRFQRWRAAPLFMNFRAVKR